MDQNRKLAQPTGVIEPCVRCRAKGIVVCPTCQGTGDIRNESYVVVDRCHDCSNDISNCLVCQVVWSIPLIGYCQGV